MPSNHMTMTVWYECCTFLSGVPLKCAPLRQAAEPCLARVPLTTQHVLSQAVHARKVDSKYTTADSKVSEASSGGRACQVRRGCGRLWPPACILPHLPGHRQALPAARDGICSACGCWLRRKAPDCSGGHAELAGTLREDLRVLEIHGANPAVCAAPLDDNRAHNFLPAHARAFCKPIHAVQS